MSIISPKWGGGIIFILILKVALMANRNTHFEAELDIRNKSIVDGIFFLRSRNLLKREVTCGYCSELMTEKILRNHVDGISWVCSNNSCNKRRTTCSIRKDSFFSFFRLSLADIWTLVIMWCEDIQIIEVQRRYGINRKTIGLVYNKLRELASNYFDLDPIRLGGPGIICQVDESLFCHKQKFGKGRT
ncbi:hypothetical protein H312_03085, partial [Anncaliia algerae PRA339]